MSDTIYFDSCVFLALLKDEENRADAVDFLLKRAAKGELQIATSAWTIVEVLNIKGSRKPILLADRDEVRKLFKNEWIIVTNVDREIAEISQEIVWKYNVSPKDSVHVATALHEKFPILYSYDNGLTKFGNLETQYGSVKISEPLPPRQGAFKLDESDNE